MRNSFIVFFLLLLSFVLTGENRENVGETWDNGGDYCGQNLWDGQGPAVIYHGRRDRKKIALTIDDGWVPDYELLDLLEREEIPCTVFIPGKLIDYRPEWIARMNDMDFEICSHGFSHKLLPFLSEEVQENEIVKTREAILSQAGDMPLLIRPSGGRLDGPYPSLPIMRSLGYTVVMWDNDVKGYGKAKDVESQRAWLWEHLQPGNIILSHFGESLNTRAVLAEWIPQVKACGYEFVLVSELIEDMEE